MINLEELPCNITNHIHNFRDFLVASWPFLNKLMQNHDWDDDGSFIGDWLQINWEMLVERELLGGYNFLTQFSTTHLTHRILNPQVLPEFAVYAKSNKQPLIDVENNSLIPDENNLRLYSFCTYKHKAFGFYPPFDLACLTIDSTAEIFIVNSEKIQFYLEPYRK